MTRERLRQSDLPENVLVRATVRRLLAILELLSAGGVLGAKGWGAELGGVATRLRHLLWSTVLREVPDEPCAAFEVAAAKAARHPCYGRAADLFLRLTAFDRDELEHNARLLAEGALAPVDGPTRFELAVVFRLIEALESALPAPWRLERTVVHRKRKEIARFVHPSGARVEVFYNQAELNAGERDQLVSRYFGGGRARPDFTVVVRIPGHPVRAVVGEVKLSDDTGYLIKGLEEALLYRWEYRDLLIGWPKAVLVVSRDSPVEVRPGDDVVVVGWPEWPSSLVVDGLLEGLLSRASRRAATKRSSPRSRGPRIRRVGP
ncbi:MAG: hypothetical protein H6737_24125 [Alphaproteobacteria bacterium]|nr:hypothetical protein [Alphaproteobacteria bacterium]